MGRTELLKRLNAIKNSIEANKLPNIYILHGDLSDTEINELYNNPKIKAMVSLTKGEGFGRPLLEFSLVNKPIIASNWSGHTDFLNSEFCALVEGTTKKVHKSAQIKDMIIGESEWFSPDLSYVSKYFDSVVTNYKEWKVKAKRQGYYARTNFSFENMNKKYSKKHFRKKYTHYS